MTDKHPWIRELKKNDGEDHAEDSSCNDHPQRDARYRLCTKEQPQE